MMVVISRNMLIITYITVVLIRTICITHIITKVIIIVFDMDMLSIIILCIAVAIVITATIVANKVLSILTACIFHTTIVIRC